jgi:hypothetical protein
MSLIDGEMREMSVRHNYRCDGLPGRLGAGIVLLLCLCVFFQMLGVPAPLLDAGGTFEIGESSVLEGWAIHAVQPELPVSSGCALIADTQRSVCVPILAGSLFRPPLS